MDHDARIDAAIIDLESQSRPNIVVFAKKFNIVCTTLLSRFKGERGTIKKTISYLRKAFMNKFNS